MSLFGFEELRVFHCQIAEVSDLQDACGKDVHKVSIHNFEPLQSVVGVPEKNILLVWTVFKKIMSLVGTK